MATITQFDYVPVLKWRQGEYQALLKLRTGQKDKIVPLLEITPPEFDFEIGKPAKSLDDHLRKFGPRLETKWGTRLALVDAGLIDPAARLIGGRHPLTGLFTDADIERVRGDWNGACDEMYRHARQRLKEIERVAKVHRDPFEPILPILEAYVDRLTGSFVEEKEYSIAWHYRNSDEELGIQRSKELIDTLVHYTANLDVQVLEGKKVIEVRCAGVNKGTAAVACRETLAPDFTLAIGDDVTDEDLFRAMPKEVHTIRVGMKSSFAGHNLRDYREVRGLLEELAGQAKPIG